ncbi:MAG: HAD family hydrolase [Candidatus Tectimicrobiota bacterium]
MGLSDIETVLFDFGGTLDAPGVHWLTRVQQLYPQVGLSVPPGRIKDAFYWADEQVMLHPEITRLTFLPLMLEHAALQLRYLDLPLEPYQRRLAEGFYYPARDALARSVRVLGMLKPYYALGVISNFYGNVVTLCQECGLAELCEVIIDSACEGVSKPAPGIFTLALERLGRPAATAVYVGDSFERDVIAARGAGLRSIWLQGVEPRPCPDATLVEATITTLDDLPSILALAAPAEV